MTRSVRISLAVFVALTLAAALLASPGALAGGSPTLSSNYYLYLQGFPGESTEDAFQGLIEIESFSWGVSRSGGARGGGGAAGKINFTAFTVHKSLDRSSPKLMRFVATGGHIPEGKLITIRESDNSELLVYCFTDLLIKNVRTVGDPESPLVEEDVTFSFRTIVQRYNYLAPQGNFQAIHQGWDLASNKSIPPGGCGEHT